jgi:hypothetical protein
MLRQELEAVTQTNPDIHLDMETLSTATQSVKGVVQLDTFDQVLAALRARNVGLRIRIRAPVTHVLSG